jgi:hypothetical protein
MNRPDANRKVAADYVGKQYKEVLRSWDGLVELSNDPLILSVQVIGDGYSLPPSYNREMGKHFNWLAERGTQAVSSSLLATGGKYDNSMTTSTTANWSTGSAGGDRVSLKYIEIMSKKGEIRDYATSFIRNDQDRREAVRLFPTIIQFRLALSTNPGSDVHLEA